ncbi:MAG: sulfatase, partial [Opitutales bacterium]|nr:sulfatase [Opitutales bacterium]
RHLYWEFFENGFQQAVRRGNWKAIRLALGEPLELYDLSKDESESNNIAANNPKIIAEMEAILKSARTPSENWPVEELD